MWDASAENLFQSFLQEAMVSSSGTGRDVHSLILSIKHFLCLSITATPTLQGALKVDLGFGQAVEARVKMRSFLCCLFYNSSGGKPRASKKQKQVLYVNSFLTKA